MGVYPPQEDTSIPPSTSRIFPVIHFAAGDAKKTAALAISFGSPIVFSGINLVMPFSISGVRTDARASVRIGPGAIALTRIPLAPKS